MRSSRDEGRQEKTNESLGWRSGKGKAAEESREGRGTPESGVLEVVCIKRMKGQGRPESGVLEVVCIKCMKGQG